MLYTLKYGSVASKPVAARWAQDTHGARWSALIDWALAARCDPLSGELDNLGETQDFIRYVIECGRQYELPTDAARGTSNYCRCPEPSTVRRNRSGSILPD
jgi:hypothetical protein